MNNTYLKLNVAEYIISILSLSEVGKVFGVSGGRCLPIINACQNIEGIDFVHASHETGAVFMADGYSRCSGKIGVVCTTSGPGATNALNGVSCSYGDKIPLLIVTGQSEFHDRGKGGIQEGYGFGRSVAICDMFKACSNISIQLTDASDIVDVLDCLLQESWNGPVHLDLPYDIQLKQIKVKRPITPFEFNKNILRIRKKYHHTEGYAKSLDLIRCSKFPLLIIGSGFDVSDVTNILELMSIGVAVCTTLGRRGCIDESLDMCLGNIGCYGQEVASNYLCNYADLILMIGVSGQYLTTIGWNESFYNKNIIDININPMTWLNSEKSIHLKIDSSFYIRSILRDLEGYDRFSENVKLILNLKNRDGYYPSKENMPNCDKHPAFWLSKISEYGYSDIFIDAGENAYWSILTMKMSGCRMWANCLWGSMGFSIGASIGASLASSKSRIAAIIGDGGLLMQGTEIHTAATERVNVDIYVIDNQSYATQFHWQRDHSINDPYKVNIDNFCIELFAKSLGASYVMAEKHFYSNMDEAPNGPRVIHCLVDLQFKPKQVSFSILKK